MKTKSKNRVFKIAKQNYLYLNNKFFRYNSKGKTGDVINILNFMFYNSWQYLWK